MTVLYLDTDVGIDDALALAFLLAADTAPAGIGTVFGNVGVDQATTNCLDLLALAGRDDIPVAAGVGAPAGQGNDGRVHGSNGLGGVELPRSGRRPVDGSAAELLIGLAHRYPGELSVVALGPLSNLAVALRLEPRLPELVRDVTIMGGAALVPGNRSPVAEANILDDPAAAAAVIAAPWPITLVPLDVTLDHTLTEPDRQALLAAGSPLPRALGAILEHYMDYYVGVYGRRACALHDPVAAAVAIGAAVPALAPAVRVVVDDTDGPGRGQTICDLRGLRAGRPDQPGAHVRVVLSLTAPFGPQLVTRLVGGATG
ncbi:MULTISPECIES: nucleoside hydrolase [Actinoplanes]|uniref:nucleoside hydrolase n=1 Tax=Actinoplanes TaxID=1865 RepID=UPI0005F27AA5|nr:MULTISPECIES: nucleoside hydrolase [Actinoplanes]GLX99704.1 inosine-uridine nucleoside N-ribohydrolase [Actinoplanes sp. NBRC 101535]